MKSGIQIDPGFFSPYSRLYVAVSGGADSLALLLLTAQATPLPVEAIHFEHGLRGEASLADAAFVADFCRSRNLPCRIIPLAVPARRRPGENLEAAARRLRLEAWLRLVEPGAAVVLGHHADDAAENLLLRLTRGANASGLTALRPKTRIRGLTLLRPLLDRRKRDLESFLRAEGIANWRHDASNDDLSFRRNFLRGQLLPELYRALPHAGAGLQRALRALALDADCLEQQADQLFAEIRGHRRTRRDFWLKLHPAVRQRVLRRYLGERLGNEFIPDARFAERFEEWLAGLGPERSRLPVGNAFWQGRGEELDWEEPAVRWQLPEPLSFGGFRYFARQVAALPPRADITSEEAFFDAEALPPILEFGLRAPGDAAVPFGRSKPVKLKHLGIARGEPVLRGGDRILWAPGHRQFAEAPVTADTRRILQLYREPEF